MELSTRDASSFSHDIQPTFSREYEASTRAPPDNGSSGPLISNNFATDPYESALSLSPLAPHQSSPIEVPQSLVANQHSMITRSKGRIKQPNPKYLNLHTRASLDTPVEPCSITSAKHHPGRVATMDEKLDANHTWTLVPYKPDINVVGCKWVYKAKLKSDGSLECLKARLVAKGFNQVDGIDFSETFSIRLALRIVVVKGWEI